MSIFNDKSLKSVAEAAAKIMQQEELKGNQTKIDANHNGKIDGQDFKILRGKKNVKEEAEDLDEASYSAKAARAGKDIGKPGKNFSMIAKKAGEQYGSAEAGKRVAGAVLAKLRKEDTELDEAFPTVEDAKKRLDAGKTSSGTVTKTKTGLVHKRDYEHNAEDDDHPEKVGRPKGHSYGARQNYKRSTRVNESMSFTEMLELYNEHGLKVLAPIEKEEIEVEGTTIEVIDADKINGYVETVVEEADEKEFNDNLEKNKAKAAGKAKQPDLAKGDTQAVKNEEVELDERHMTGSEMEKREKIVKSMKKGISGFKSRYGDRAKSVMYATATKQAMKKD